MKRMGLWLVGVVIALSCAWAQTYPLKPEEVVPGEILLRLKPGYTIETARQIASAYGASVVPIAVQDTYVLRLPTNAAPAVLLQRVYQVIEEIAKRPEALYVEPHWRVQLDDIPNDPLFPQQWALQMMKAPGAWDIEKGQPGIRIAIIDDNFLRQHPDLESRYDPLSRNFVANPPDENIDPEGTNFSHGTAVMGVALAATNNGVGIAGLCWEGVTAVALKTTAATTGGLDGENVLEALQYVLDNAEQISVLNMSFGSPFPSSQMNDLIQRIYSRGVVPVASAGNEGSERARYPADFPNVVKVSAVNRFGEKAGFSNYGNVDLAAPGADVLTTQVFPQYAPIDGTSFSAPYVAAAVAMVLSAGVRRHEAGAVEPEAVTILKDNADSRGRPTPDPELGAGIVDLEAALRNTGGVSITFTQPVAGTVVDTRIQRVQVLLRRVQNSDLANVNVRLNGDLLPRSLWEEGAVVNPERKVISLDFTVSLPGEGRHTITVEAIGEDGVLGSRTTQVVVKARVQNPGLAMFSTPYNITASPEEVFGNSAILARYIPSEGTYARYSAANRDPRASFAPPDVQVRPEGSNTPTPPRGLGYFVRNTEPAFILGDEQVDTNTAYLIPLEPGWNLIGNPFPFNVPWVACEVEVVGAGGIVQRFSLQEAAEREYIRPQIYRYIPLTGEYTWRTAPLGELIAWQAHWVRALKPCTLVVPPVGSLRSRPDETPRVVPAQLDGWLVRLIARSGDREDANNFIGTAANASDELAKEDVEKPPAFQSYVALRILDSRTRSALAQDLRRNARRTQRWEIEVATDQPNAEVTLQWSQELAVPKGTRLVLIDQVTGERISMLQSSSHRFRTDETGRRRFVIEAQPARTSRLQVTNVSVTQTRGNQFTVQYALNEEATVQVLVQDATGRVLARLHNGTRAAGVSTATWNGRTDSGVAVPPGTYQVLIIATSDEGEVARAVRSLVVVR